MAPAPIEFHKELQLRWKSLAPAPKLWFKGDRTDQNWTTNTANFFWVWYWQIWQNNGSYDEITIFYDQ